jgi:hypothetical protein
VPDVTVVVADAAATPAGTRVEVVVDGGAGGRAAVRVGAQLALHTGADLAVAPVDQRRTRRSAAAVAALSRRGVTVAAADPATVGAAGILVVPVDLPAPDGGEAAVLRVRATTADADDEIEQVVERIAVGAANDS